MSLLARSLGLVTRQPCLINNLSSKFVEIPKGVPKLVVISNLYRFYACIECYATLLSAD